MTPDLLALQRMGLNYLAYDESSRMVVAAFQHPDSRDRWFASGAGLWIKKAYVDHDVLTVVAGETGL